METLRGTQENEPLRVPLRLFNVKANITNMSEPSDEQDTPEMTTDENQLTLWTENGEYQTPAV